MASVLIGMSSESGPAFACKRALAVDALYASQAIPASLWMSFRSIESGILEPCSSNGAQTLRGAAAWSPWPSPHFHSAVTIFRILHSSVNGVLRQHPLKSNSCLRTQWFKGSNASLPPPPRY